MGQGAGVEVVGAMEVSQPAARTARDVEFAEYMSARQPSLLRTAYLLTGDRHAAEDLVQTALAKLYLSWDRVQSRDLVDGYVRRILVNENSSLWRRAWKRREITTDELPERAASGGVWPDPHDPAATSGQPSIPPSVQLSVQASARRAALWEFVQTLPRRQRAVVVLRYYEDLTEAEVAEVLGISVGTVKSQSSRALAALRQRVHTQPMLAREGDEER